MIDSFELRVVQNEKSKNHNGRMLCNVIQYLF